MVSGVCLVLHGPLGSIDLEIIGRDLSLIFLAPGLRPQEEVQHLQRPHPQRGPAAVSPQGTQPLREDQPGATTFQFAGLSPDL